MPTIVLERIGYILSVLFMLFICCVTCQVFADNQVTLSTYTEKTSEAGRPFGRDESQSTQRVPDTASGVEDDGTYGYVAKLSLYQGYITETTSTLNVLNCTASLVSSEWVLTAAHCVDGPSNSIAVQFRNISTEHVPRLLVTEKYLAPEYRSENQSYPVDLALLRVDSSSIEPSLMPTIPRLNLGKLTHSDIGQSATSVVHGEGNDPFRPHKRTVFIRDPDVEHPFEGVAHTNLISVSRSQNVTENDTGAISRKGDSGSPLIYNDMIQGPLVGGSDAGYYTALWPHRNFILKTMGLQWLNWANTLDERTLFQLPDKSTLCRTATSDTLFYGTIKKYNDRPYCYYFHRESDQGSESVAEPDTFQVAYAPFFRPPTDQWLPADAIWQIVSFGQMSENAIPVDYDEEGQARYLCIETSAELYPGGPFPDVGTMRKTDRHCHGVAPDSDPDQAETRVLTFQPDRGHYGRIISNGEIKVSDNDSKYYLNGAPCYRAEPTGLKIGILEPVENPFASGVDQYQCRIGSKTYLRYQIETMRGSDSHAFLFKKWQSWEEANTSFYDYLYGALKYTTPKLYDQRSDLAFCRILPNFYGTVDLTSEFPICHTLDGAHSEDFQLFSKSWPTHQGYSSPPAPDWQMIVKATHKESGEHFFCNGVKVSAWLVAVAGEALGNRSIDEYDYEVVPFSTKRVVAPYKVSKLKYESHPSETKEGSESDNAIAFLLTTSPMFGRGNVPFASRSEEQDPVSLYGSFSELFAMTFTTGKNNRQDRPLSIRRALPTLRVNALPTRGNRYYHLSAYETMQPAGLSPPPALELCPDKMEWLEEPDRFLKWNYNYPKVIPESFALTFSKNNQLKLFGLARESRHCSFIIPASVIAGNMVQNNIETEAKVVSGKDLFVIPDNEPCWVGQDSSKEALLGVTSNQSCIWKNDRYEGFFALPDPDGGYYQWLNKQQSMRSGVSVMHFGYTEEGERQIMVKRNNQFKLIHEGEDIAGDVMLVSVDTSEQSYDTPDWQHCHNEACSGSLMVEATEDDNNITGGFCAIRSGFEWLSGYYLHDEHNLSVCHIQNTAPTSAGMVRASHDYYIMQNLPFYARYGVRPLWSTLPEENLDSSVFQMEDGKYLCRRNNLRGLFSIERAAQCQAIFNPDGTGDIEKLLKYYPLTSVFYPNWSKVTPQNRQSIADGWIDGQGDENEEKGALCLQINTKSHQLELGHFQAGHQSGCDISDSEPASVASDHQHFMVLQGRNYTWRPNRVNLDNAVIAQYHPSLAKSEYVCRSMSGLVGKTSLDHKYCLIGAAESQESVFELLIHAEPTPPSFSTTAPSITETTTLASQADFHSVSTAAQTTDGSGLETTTASGSQKVQVTLFSILMSVFFTLNGAAGL